jgi:hypothetical protein
MDERRSLRGVWRSVFWHMPSLAVLACLLLVGCASAAASRPAGRAPTATARRTRFSAYVDARLGFSLALPAGWTALPSPALRARPNIGAVALADSSHPGTLVLVSVLRGPAMAAAFAARGTPDSTIGPYPAFVADTDAATSRVPCLIRIFLAGQDYVVGEECARDAPAHAAALTTLLATYLPAAPSDAVPVQPARSAQEDCGTVQRLGGYDPATAAWGRMLARPRATSPAVGWGALQPGVFVCSNTGSPDRYLFQCTELVNRLDWELFALPRFTGHSELYFDYADANGTHPGQVRSLLPAGTYALYNDAAQGTSASAPAPGDLLIFQDVHDAAAGWRSGIRAGTLGHVAIVTAVDASHVYIAQENYNDWHYFLALPLTHTSAGWHITDLSGLPNRIVRGWIRFVGLGA